MNWLIHWISTWLTSPHALTMDGWVWLVAIPVAAGAVAILCAIAFHLMILASFRKFMW